EDNRAAPSAAKPTPTKTPPTVAQIYASVGPSVAVIRTAKGALGTGVVADGSAVTVLFSDGTRSAATVASANPKTDIATLTPQTLPQTLVPATIGGSA